MPSAVKKGWFGGLPRLRQSNLHACQRRSSRAQRPCRAQWRKEVRGGGLPRLRLYNSHARQKRPSRAQRPGRSQRKRRARGGPPTTTQHSTPTRRIKPSAVAKRSEAEKEVSRVSLDCDSSCLALCKGLGHNRPLIFARAICATQAHSPSARSNGFCVIWVVYKSNSPCAKKSRSDHTERSAKTVPFD